jgi:hypothetical protein
MERCATDTSKPPEPLWSHARMRPPRGRPGPDMGPAPTPARHTHWAPRTGPCSRFVGTPRPGGDDLARTAGRWAGSGDREPSSVSDRPYWRRSAVVSGAATSSPAPVPRAWRLLRLERASRRSADIGGRRASSRPRASRTDRAHRRRRSDGTSGKSSGAAGRAGRRSRTGPASLARGGCHDAARGRSFLVAPQGAVNNCR